MSINKTLLKDDRRLVNTVKTQSRNIRELKTPQKVGADVLQVQSLPDSNTVLAFPGGSGTYTLAANSLSTVYHAFPANYTTLTLWNFLVSLYVDPTSFSPGGIADSAHLFPVGGSLTDAQRNMRFESWIDWADSSDTTNARMFIINVWNMDSAPHNIALYLKAYLPNLNQSATS
jgi:hypothetical protein